jgi:Cu2+-containing amine oxidase
VVWANISLHHLVRTEDLPVMPTLWHSFKLRPFNFFDRNRGGSAHRAGGGTVDGGSRR